MKIQTVVLKIFGGDLLLLRCSYVGNCDIRDTQHLKFPLFWIGVKDLQEYFRLSCNAILMVAMASDTLANL